MPQIRTPQPIAMIFIVAFFILPIILIATGILPFWSRYPLMIAALISAVCIIWVERWSFDKLGLNMAVIQEGALWYILFTLFAIIFIDNFAALIGQPTQSILSTPHFQYGFMLVSFAQEFLYRLFLIPLLQRISMQPLFVIGVNSMLFGLLHIIYPQPLLLFFLTAFLGIGFAGVYLYRPNIVLVTLSHAVINFVAVYHCFPGITEACTG